MSKWFVDPWSDDNPAVKLGRIYLEPPPVVGDPPPPPTRRERIAALAERVRTGDAMAARELSNLLDEPVQETP